MKKSMIRYTLSLAFMTIFIVVSFAQPLREVPYEAMVKAADESYLTGDYFNAIEWYEKAYKEQKDKDFAIKIAESYMNLRDFKRASSWYDRVISRDRTDSYGKYKLEYGRVLKIMGEYSKSYEVLNEFVNESEDIERKKQAVLLINGIAKSSEFSDNVDVIIAPLASTVNSPSSEAGPRSLGADVYFSSLNRKDELVYNSKLEGETHFKIYSASPDEKKGGFGKSAALNEEINREGYHTGNPSFNSDGTKMYFTRTLIEDNVILESKIYVSERNGSDWGPSEEVDGGVNGEYLLKYPAVGELFGKNVLFFASNMEGGFGGYDLYYAESKGNGMYGTPINLGESINTSYDEVTPFYKDGDFYFSTEGFPGYGSMDIFKTTWDGSSWSEVTNMGSGYNTSYDDMYYTLDEAGLQGFIVSNRPSDKKRSVMSKTCCDDIFAVNIKEVVIDLLAKVTDGKNPLKEAEIKLIDLSKGEDKEGPQFKSNFTSNDFNFALLEDKPYRIVVTRKGYYPDSLEFNTVGILDDFTVERTIALKIIPPPPPPPTEETVTISTNEPIRMNNIYYDFDSDVILQSAEVDLYYIMELMNKYPDMVIELSSHTDSKGVSKYNEELSQRRANSAKSFLTNKGIDQARIQAVGYGENVILNRCVNGVRCSDDEHRFNRRTEFKIISGPKTIEVKKQKTIVTPGGGLPMNYDVDAYSFPSHSSIESKKKAILSFKNNDYQIGELKLGETVDMEFEFINIGDEDLIIEIVTACHCTAFEYSKEPVKPNGKAIIYVAFNSEAKGKTGTFREVVNIICNTENVVEEAVFNVTVIE